MGCGSSASVVPTPETSANGHKVANGKAADHHKSDDDDDLPTVTLPETPVKPRPPPVAFEIPLEDLAPRKGGTPPPHLQRLLQPPAETTLPAIEEKLAEAEMRRLQILQQRAASAQKRTQKMLKSFSEMERVDSERESSMDYNDHKHQQHLTLPPMPGACEDKNI